MGWTSGPSESVRVSPLLVPLQGTGPTMTPKGNLTSQKIFLGTSASLPSGYRCTPRQMLDLIHGLDGIRNIAGADSCPCLGFRACKHVMRESSGLQNQVKQMNFLLCCSSLFFASTRINTTKEARSQKSHHATDHCPQTRQQPHFGLSSKRHTIFTNKSLANNLNHNTNAVTCNRLCLYSVNYK